MTTLSSWVGGRKGNKSCVFASGASFMVHTNSRWVQFKRKIYIPFDAELFSLQDDSVEFLVYCCQDIRLVKILEKIAKSKTSISIFSVACKILRNMSFILFCREIKAASFKRLRGSNRQTVTEIIAKYWKCEFLGFWEGYVPCIAYNFWRESHWALIFWGSV